MTELLPCPFCGASPVIANIKPHSHKGGIADFMPDHLGSSYVECGCGAGLIDATEDRVVERWNTRAQPEYLSGCLHPSEFGCQFYGKCMSEACVHYGKTECRPRMTVLAQVDGILYPKETT